MMNEHIPNGYVVLARKIRKSPLWLSLKATHRLVLIELLLQASFQDGPVVRNGEIIELKRGQIATSYQMLVDEISDKDVTVKVVRCAIEKLVKHGFLAKDEAKARAKQGLLLTVVKYGFYQDTENYKGKANDKEKGITRAKGGQREGKGRAINNNGNNVNESNNGESKNNSSQKSDEIPPKTNYAEFVKMKSDEYEKLVSEYGEDFTKECILVLDNYKGAKGVKYKDDYRAIKNWVVNRVQEDRSKVRPFPKAKQSSNSSLNRLQELYKQAEEAERHEAHGGY